MGERFEFRVQINIFSLFYRFINYMTSEFSLKINNTFISSMSWYHHKLFLDKLKKIHNSFNICDNYITHWSHLWLCFTNSYPRRMYLSSTWYYSQIYEPILRNESITFLPNALRRLSLHLRYNARAIWRWYQVRSRYIH